MFLACAQIPPLYLWTAPFYVDKTLLIGIILLFLCRIHITLW